MITVPRRGPSPTPFGELYNRDEDRRRFDERRDTGREDAEQDFRQREQSRDDDRLGIEQMLRNNDVQVDDKKLTQLNAQDAKKNRALILENTKVNNVERFKDCWKIFLENGQVITAKILINASGPWINEVVKDIIKIKSNKSIRLVKGSHIIIKKLYDEEIAFTLQNEDKRIIFVIPYKEKYSLIGTTEVEVKSPENPKINEEEIKYLIQSANNYFIKQINSSDIIDTYAGIRPLIEDFKEATKVTRDYIFDLNVDDQLSPLLSIYGGKLTTYRKLSDKVFDELKLFLPSHTGKSWTDKKKL